jgi:holliday junction DNA helicase RuvA
MIGRISGKLIAKQPPQIVIDVHGIGYEVDVPMSTLYALPATGEPVSLVTHFVVREDAQLLFGFATESERQAFRKLLKISGVGPKVALAVLSGLSVEELYAAVRAQEPARLVRIPGIGKKTAERLLLELRGKSLASEAKTDSVGAEFASAHNDVIDALLALGYGEREAVAATKDLPSETSVSDAIRSALKRLAK